VSKPIVDIKIRTTDDATANVKAVFDSGSFYTIVHEDKVPSAASVVRRKSPRTLGAAARGSQLTAVGDVSLVLTIGNKEIDDAALVSPNLVQEMLVGARTMQKWDISIINRNGSTQVSIGRDG
jgi:hypothetical protein